MVGFTSMLLFVLLSVLRKTNDLKYIISIFKNKFNPIESLTLNIIILSL